MAGETQGLGGGPFFMGLEDILGTTCIVGEDN